MGPLAAVEILRGRDGHQAGRVEFGSTGRGRDPEEPQEKSPVLSTGLWKRGDR